MKTSYDVFAETNPALCAGSLLSFASAHHSEKGVWPELIVSYFVLPIALSQDTAGAFEGTNKTTGLLAWLGRMNRPPWHDVASGISYGPRRP
ncbi:MULTISPECIES: three component ABC system middle component [Roseobacteraceae]|uniref:three component ABC system middle component n=1 Tax=Roseobacteraceae TaxID=2854170 RepID=UPI000DE81A06